MNQILYKLSAVILLAFMTVVMSSCGGSDNPTITKETLAEDTPTATLPNAEPGAGDIDPVADGTPAVAIRGVLSDKGTKKALAGTPVELVDAQGNMRQSMTTDTGLFAFENLAVNQPFTLKFFRDGYQMQEIRVEPIPEGETKKIIVELAPILKPDELPPGEGLSLNTDSPNFSLSDGNGKKHALADYAGEKKVVLIFYRGNW